MADQILGAGRSTLNTYTDPRSTLYKTGGAGRGFFDPATDPRSLTNDGPTRDLGGVGFGAPPDTPTPVDSVDIGNQSSSSQGSNSGGSSGPDLRVTIKVPSDYVSGYFTGGSDKKELSNLQSIIFPYTPQISFEHKAAYTTITPTHSNYAINFYKASSVEDISISGIFTVQNDTDAQVYLSTIFLLRALTKMRFSTDSDAGSPPPICRLNAYGPHMLANIPVAITSFKNDFPNDVDYYQTTSSSFGNHLVPIKSTIAVNCKVMFSRAEMLGASVTDFLAGNGLGV